MESIWDHFAGIAASQPDRLAVKDAEKSWTYHTLMQQSTAYARAFLAQGVEPGEHVALLLKNCPEWIAAQLALAQIGAVLVPVNTRYRTEELRYCLHQSESVALLTMPEFLGSNYHAMLSEIMPRLGHAALPRLRQVISVGEAAFPGGMTLDTFVRLGERRGDADLAARRAVVRPDDISLIIYTSGTTGKSKGAMLDQGQVLLNARTLREYANVTPADRILMLGPFFHILGFSYGVNGAIYAGAASVALPTFHAERALELIEGEHISIISGTPTMFQMMMARPDFASRDLSSLRFAWIGGAPSTPALIEEILRNFPGVRLFSGFGMSETMGVSKNRPDDTPEIIATTVGVPHDYLEVRIVDPRTGKEAPRGASGELWLRGPNITRGYYNMPEETAQAITPDAWLRTGDLFVHEPDGHLRVTGRLKELYIRGGTNIYPIEVENFLSRHPAIKQVCVVGVPDKVYGEVGMAFVELRPGMRLTEEELQAYCKGKIASYKIPQHVHVTDRFPLTASGKVQKFKLRQEGCKLRGLG
ncbi:MAG: AMP-binding protein [Candidatus Tectomicrobia bacterium]|nr:AMP-binding protein [Candidatus Tectomicrobia bacterium]